MKDLIKQKVIDYTPELLKYLDELVSYPSLFSDDALPFGQANIDCLNHALEIGSNLGVQIKMQHEDIFNVMHRI